MDMKRQQLLTTCINVLKEPTREPNKDAESKQVQSLFTLSMKSSHNLTNLQDRGQKKISDVLFEFEELYYAIPSVPLNITNNAIKGMSKIIME